MTAADLENLRANTAAFPRTTPLFREAGLRTMLLHLNAGENIPEHQTRGALLVHCLSGRGAFASGDERTDLRPGVLISVPPAAPHSVTAAADQEVLLLVTISEQVAAAQ
ncbi:MAG TPA: cupin domain-containing protein [Bryobacteraceae bacterium]|jgi:quercetin dioxygenase-like cupin family protein|nr:cupin domain-containing protein [Bryobacteraceae bacterium]